jgi:hypothetical protein
MNFDNNFDQNFFLPNEDVFTAFLNAGGEKAENLYLKILTKQFQHR